MSDNNNNDFILNPYLIFTAITLLFILVYTIIYIDFGSLLSKFLFICLEAMTSCYLIIKSNYN